MTRDKQSSLTQLLGDQAQVSQLVQKLDERDSARLAGLLQVAQEKQAKAIQQASEESLQHIPMMLRGAVRKLLF